VEEKGLILRSGNLSEGTGKGSVCSSESVSPGLPATLDASQFSLGGILLKGLTLRRLEDQGLAVLAHSCFVEGLDASVVCAVEVKTVHGAHRLLSNIHFLRVNK